MQSTQIILNVDLWAAAMLNGTVFLGLLAIVWKGKKEIGDAIAGALAPITRTVRNATLAIAELQTAMRVQFPATSITQSLTEAAGSPLSPTEYGATLIRDSGLEGVLNDNRAALTDRLRALLPKSHTPYDVQERARELLVGMKDDPMMSPVKNWVYENPIDIEIILRTGALWLRDDFLGVTRAINHIKRESHI